MSEASPPQLRLSAGCHSVVGTVRGHNEDAALCEPSLALFAVADGLGGHNAGERASGLATEALQEGVAEARADGEPATLEVLLAAFERGNARILEDARRHPEREGMGTTLTALTVAHDRLLIGHVGDCRVWRIRDGQVEQLTQDHTLVGQQLRDGVINAAEAATHPMRHVLSRCLGVREELEVDLVEVDLAAEDVFVVASDGILPGLDLARMQELVRDLEDSEELARLLVEEACEIDGSDNITAVVVRCEPA